MKAKIKSYHSPDIFDLEIFTPKKIDNFKFLLQVLIGSEGMEGGESFDFGVRTPRWLLEDLDVNEVL